MRMLRKALDPIPVMETSEVGLDVDAKEAIAFAVMAYETAHSRPSNVPFATGARKSVVLGKLTPNGTAAARMAMRSWRRPTDRAPQRAGYAHAESRRGLPKVARPAVAPKAKAAAR